MFPIRPTRVTLVAGLYLLAAAAPRIAAFLLLPIYAFELSPDELAAYGVAISLVQIIGIVADAGMVSGMANSYFRQPVETRPSYLKSAVLVSRLVALLLLLPIGILLAVFWDALLGDGLSRAKGIWLVLAFAYLQRGNTLAGLVYRVRRQHGQFATTRIVPAIVQIAAGTILVFALHLGALGAVAAAPMGFLISILVVGLRRRNGGTIKFMRLRRPEIVLLFSRGLPLLPEQLARWGQLMSLRPLLSLFSDVQQTAAFTFSNAPAQIVSPFAEAYVSYMMPKYYESAVSEDIATVRRLRELTSMFLAVGAAGAILSIVSFEPLFRLLAPAPYRGAFGLAAVALAGIVLRAPMALLGQNLRMENRRLAPAMTVVIGVAVSYVQFFTLVQYFGAWSAAWSIYLYPATSSIVIMFLLRNSQVRLVSPRDLSITALTVLGVLATMLSFHDDKQDGLVFSHIATVVCAAILGLTIVVWLVVRPALKTTLVVVNGGLHAPVKKAAS